MNVEDIQAAFDAVLAQYNAGVLNRAARDAAERQYNLAMAELGAMNVNTQQILKVGLVLGLGYFALKFAGKR